MPSSKGMNAERQRLEAQRRGAENWRLWGPYLSERAWGTVREDYSPYGDAWEYLPHDNARSRAYRWGEDGIGGISDMSQAASYFALGCGTVQVCTAAMLDQAIGPNVIKTLKQGMSDFLEKNAHRGGTKLAEKWAGQSVTADDFEDAFSVEVPVIRGIVNVDDLPLAIRNASSDDKSPTSESRLPATPESTGSRQPVSEDEKLRESED